MSRVDFYVVPGKDEQARQQFACRLAEKAYRLEHRVHIHTDDAQAASAIDDRLWTFRDGSFVPHEVLRSDSGDVAAPVTIGYADAPPAGTELLINLSGHVPSETGSFPRIAEIVTSDETSRQQSRQRYTQYRDLGHKLETHKL